MNVTVRNVITSMRLISWFDWAEFVESVEPRRRRSCAQRARSARWTSRPATATATRSRSSPGDRGGPRSRSRAGAAGGDGRTARRHADDGRTPPRSRTRGRRDPGYYLISDGRAGARARPRRPRAGAEPPPARLRPGRRRAATSARSRSSRRSSSPSRLWLLLSGDRGVAALVVAHPRPRARPRTWRSRSSTDAVTRSLGPRPLPRLDLDDGVPTELRTLVVVPMLLTNAGGRRRPGRRRWRSTTWATARAISGSRCCPIGSMPPTEHADGDDDLLAAAAAAHRSAQRAPRRGARRRRPLPALPPRRGAGTRASSAGWAGSASAASSRS